MIEILNFIFKSFWHFIGTLLLLGAIGNIIGNFFQKPITINNIIPEQNKTED